MDGSAIRREIVGQHAGLTTLLDEVEDLARRFEEELEEVPADADELRARGLALYETFGTHLDSEQELLEPALRKAGPEGERLARRLCNEHREQRELLGYLIGRIEQHPEPTILIARELQNFAVFLRIEMATEEKTMLSEALLDGVRD